MALINRSLASVRNGHASSLRGGQERGGTRVKCLLAVAAGVCFGCAALLLLAKLYSEYVVGSGAVSSQQLEQLRSQALQKQTPRRKAPLLQRPVLQQAGYEVRNLPSEQPALPTTADTPSQAQGKPGQTGSSSGFVQEQHFPVDSTAEHAFVPGAEKSFADAEPYAGAASGQGVGARQGQQGLDTHFVVQARRNERVLDLEQTLRGELSRSSCEPAAETLDKLLRIIGTQSLGGFKWQGFYAMRCGNWATAEKFYSLALGRSPEDIQCRYNLTLAQLRQNEKSAATVNYQRLKALAPRSGLVKRLAPYFEPQ